ncbi:hypothetical protein AAE478_009756 [Parahypoxylon ruwenzoriense]
MALVSMIQVSLCLDSQDSVDYYSLEAEKLIRLRGLKRNKSREVRLLHHCYAFWRIFHESMYPASVECGKPSKRADWPPTAEIASTSGCPSGRTWKRRCRKELGENDLHIERPGSRPQTLYPEIFGTPEPWMFVLSLIVRLAKEKDAAERDEVADPLPLADFLDRAKSIKKAIAQLRTQCQAENSSIENRPADRLMLKCFVDAIHYALEIFFYKRIYIKFKSYDF